MKTLHLDCSAGVSGDMFVGALVDLGADLEVIKKDVESLGLGELTVSASKALVHGLAGTRFRVIDQSTGDDADVPSSGSKHPHRGLSEVLEIIWSGKLSDRVRSGAQEVFTLLAQAEAKVHGATVDEVHFHEVGALDAIGDIVSACSAVAQLDPQLVTATSLRVGFGTVKCAHGVLPVPAPGTLEILGDVPIYAGDVEGELVTPTGAALVKHFADRFTTLPIMTVKGTGYGAGTKDFGIPPLFRVILGEGVDATLRGGTDESKDQRAHHRR